MDKKSMHKKILKKQKKEVVIINKNKYFVVCFFSKINDEQF